MPVCLLLALLSLTLLVDVEPLFVEGRRRVATAVLLWLLVAVVFVINAAFRDGTVASPFPRVVGCTCDVHVYNGAQEDSAAGAVERIVVQTTQQDKEAIAAKAKRP